MIHLFHIYFLVVRKPVNRNVRKVFLGPKKPGWSEFVQAKHVSAVDAYRIWRENGKPRHGLIFDIHIRAKLNYKYAIRAIKRNIDTIRADNAANKLASNDYAGFWNAVRKFNGKSNTVLLQCIGDTKGENEICNEWKSHFSRIYNSVTN